MAFVQKPNSGAVFVNDKKETDNHPDRKGDCNIDGVEYWVSGWLKKTNAGASFLSLSFTPKVKAEAPAPRQAAPRSAPAPATGTGFDEMDSDIPW